jgi:xanthine dehydrogenase accessory factor
VLTHDPKFDVPLLLVALRLPQIGYIGAMGSRRTHEDRLARLREAGVTDAELGGLASPIGLDLGARTPEETAVSIAAEIIARRWGGRGRPLTEVGGRIHHDGLAVQHSHPDLVARASPAMGRLGRLAAPVSARTAPCRRAAAAGGKGCIVMHRAAG